MARREKKINKLYVKAFYGQKFIIERKITINTGNKFKK